MSNHWEIANRHFAEADSARAKAIETSALARDEAYGNDAVAAALESARFPDRVSIVLGRSRDMSFDFEYLIIRYEESVVVSVDISDEVLRISLFYLARMELEMSPTGVCSSFTSNDEWTYQNGMYQFNRDAPTMHSEAREVLSLMEQFARGDHHAGC